MPNEPRILKVYVIRLWVSSAVACEVITETVHFGPEVNHCPEVILPFMLFKSGKIQMSKVAGARS